jgi:Na+-driven multidrug efflux pump
MIKRYVGSRTFYRQVAVIAIPIIIQNGITNFVSLLDNIMIGQVGTLQMSGVSIVNQLIFVFNLCIFGASSGAGIFTAQFHGSQDHTGIRHTFRFKILSCLLLSFSCIILFLLGGNGLISVYLLGEGNPQDAADVLMYGREYLEVMLWGFVPFALSNAYASTLRETGQTTIPMVGGILAVFVNLILNCVLIFGLLGAPAMGVQGAALATVCAALVNASVILLLGRLQKYPYLFHFRL